MKTTFILFCILLSTFVCCADSDTDLVEYNKRLENQLNSYGSSNFEFANCEFFRELENKTIYLYNMNNLTGVCT